MMKKTLKRHDKKRNIDLLLDKLVYVLSLFQNQRNIPKKVKRIIVLKFSGIGDGILALPAINGLYKKGFDIDVACSKENEVVFKNQKFINKVYTLDIEKSSKLSFFKFIAKLRKEKYDVCIDTSQSSFISALTSRLISKYAIGFKNVSSVSRNKFFDRLITLDPEKHMVKNYYHLVKDFHITENLRLIPPKTHKKTDILYTVNASKGIVGIHATGPLFYKNWPKKNHAIVIDHLLNKGYSILLFGGPKEKKDNDAILKLLRSKNKGKVINLSGVLSLEEVLYILPKLRLFIANDGGPMHLAASHNLPVIGIFGAETPLRYAPFNKKSYSLYKPFKNGPIIKAYQLHWPTKENSEIPNKITPSEVLETIELIEKKD